MVTTGHFEVVGDELRFKAGTELDFEIQSQYSVLVEVSDGENTFEQSLIVGISNQLELDGAVVIETGGPSRSMIREMTVSFDEIIAFPTDAFGVYNKSTLAEVDVTVDLDNSSGKSVATLSFAGSEVDPNNGSLLDGYYELTIDGSSIQSASTDQTLDGDSDGLGGGTYVFGSDPTDEFFRLFGDIDGDQTVGLIDFAAFRSTFGANESDANFESGFDDDDNGTIGLIDFARFRASFGKTI